MVGYVGKKGADMHREVGDTKNLKSGTYTLVSDNENVRNEPVYLHVPVKKNVAEDLGGWFIAWQEASMLLAADKRMNLTDHRVLLVLQAKLDFENWIKLSLADIGEPIGVAKSNVSVSMKKMLEIGVVILGPTSKNVKTYRLNPAIGWKGDLRQGATERRKALRVINGGKAAETLTVSTDPDQLPLF